MGEGRRTECPKHRVRRVGCVRRQSWVVLGFCPQQGTEEGNQPGGGGGGIVTEPQVAPPRRLGRAFQRDPLERVAGVRGRGGQSSLLRAALGSVPMSSFKNVLICKKRSRNTGLGSRTRPRHKCEVAEDRADGTGRASRKASGGGVCPPVPHSAWRAAGTQ